MLARWLGLAALLALVPALTACGGAPGAASETAGNQLTVYSSLPLQGENALISEQIVGGEKLALAQAGGHVGAFKVSYYSLDDANPTNGQPSPGETAGNAKQAAQDTSTIAYLGDFSSDATAISLPNLNAAGILQVSPASPYVGLTQSLDAGQDEPGRFYLSGKRNFGRLMPGDPAQARAQVKLLQSLAVHKVFVLDDQGAFQMPLASILAGYAEQAGIEVAAHDSIAIEPESVFKGEVEKIAASRADAVVIAAGHGEGTVNLLRELHEADPHLLLIGGSAMANQEFAAKLGAAGSVSYATTPILPEAMYPAAGRKVIADYRRRFGGEAGPWVLYGYEAMAVVLDSIRRAGSRGNNRTAVISRFMATRDRASVLGRYSIEADGETTLAPYAADRLAHGRVTFWRAFDTTPARR